MTNRELQELLDTAEQNLHALELFSAYLHICPCYVTREDAVGLAQSCDIPEETAVQLLVASACGLDTADDPVSRRMFERYFKRAVHGLNTKDCQNDPYYQRVRMPEIIRGRWRMGQKCIKAYELFTLDDPLILRDGREIPQLGYFTTDFYAPMVEENNREWMTVTPSEISTMTRDIDSAFGKVAVFGLGLGYYAFRVSEMNSVSQVVVIEKDSEVISLFEEYLLPQFPNRQKITVVEADAFEYAKTMGSECFDFAYVDIWHDVLDGVAMYLKMKRLEKHSPNTVFTYWIEPSMLCWLRGMALMEVAEGVNGPMLQTIGGYRDTDDLKRKLSNEALRALAPSIPLEVTQREA